PLVGSMQAKLLRGGAEVRPQTFPIWFWAHVALLTLALLGLGVMVWRRLTPRFEGRQVVRPLLAVVPLLLISASVSPPLTAAATSADYGLQGARPEWYILPLHSLLDIAQGFNPKLAFVGTMVIPGLILVAVLALPWLHKRPRTLTASAAVAAICVL